MGRCPWLVTLMMGCALQMGCPGRAEFFADTFEECGRDRDCAFFPDDLCFTVRNAGIQSGMCSFECFDDLDCLAFSVCEDIDGPFICYQRCFDDFDCPPGFACFLDEVAEVDVCLVF